MLIGISVWCWLGVFAHRMTGDLMMWLMMARPTRVVIDFHCHSHDMANGNSCHRVFLKVSRVDPSNALTHVIIDQNDLGSRGMKSLYEGYLYFTFVL